jgi:hypothetical protein
MGGVVYYPPRSWHSVAGFVTLVRELFGAGATSHQWHRTSFGPTRIEGLRSGGRWLRRRARIRRTRIRAWRRRRRCGTRGARGSIGHLGKGGYVEDLHNAGLFYGFPSQPKHDSSAYHQHGYHYLQHQALPQHGLPLLLCMVPEFYRRTQRRGVTEPHNLAQQRLPRNLRRDKQPPFSG